VGAAPGPAAPHLLSGHGLQLDWRWSDAWRWWRDAAPLRIAALQAATLDLHLLRDTAGRATWQLGARARGEPSTATPADDTPDDLPRVDQLLVGSGRIEIDDRPLATRLRVTLQGGEGDPAKPAAAQAWRARVDGQWKALPLQLAIVTGRAMPLVADVASADIDLKLTGQVGAARISFDGRAGALLGARRLDGALTFSGPSLDRVGKPLGVTLPQTPPFQLEGQLRHDAGLWQLKARRATIGRSQLAGDFNYDTRPSTPMLSGKLTGSRLALADLGPAVGAGIGSAAPAGRVLPQRSFDLPSLRAMDADVQADIRELDFGTDGLAPLRDVSTHVRLKDGRLALEQIQAQVAGGRLTGDSAYDSRSTPARWTAKVKLTGVDIAGWVRSTQTPEAAQAPPAAPTQTRQLKQQRQQARQGGDQRVRHYITGALEASVDLRGQGRSTGEILSTLDGGIDLLLREGTLSHLVTELAGLDLAQALGVVVRGDRPLPLRCARLQATAHNGIVRTDRGVLDNADSTVWLSGQVNLKDETLALVARSRPKDLSPLSLRTPVTVRGTLAQPVVGIDGARLAGKLGTAALMAAAMGPLAALLPLVDLGHGADADPCTAPPPAARAASAAAPARP
jgi:AsmA family protein